MTEATVCGGAVRSQSHDNWPAQLSSGHENALRKPPLCVCVCVCVGRVQTTVQVTQIGCLVVYHTSRHGVALLRAGLKCAARGSLEMQDPKIAKKSPSEYHDHRRTLSGYIFATKTCIDNRKKFFKRRCVPHMSVQYGELRFTSGWDLLASLRHPCKFQRVSRVLTALLHGI